MCEFRPSVSLPHKCSQDLRAIKLHYFYPRWAVLLGCSPNHTGTWGAIGPYIISHTSSLFKVAMSSLDKAAYWSQNQCYHWWAQTGKMVAHESFIVCQVPLTITNFSVYETNLWFAEFMSFSGWVGGLMPLTPM